MSTSREVECPERLGYLVGRHGIEQIQRVDALQRRAHRGDVRHVSPDWLNAHGELALGGVVANERADMCALPDEPLEDLRSDGPGATCDENGHRPAPCCKPKTAVDDVAIRCSLETGLGGKSAFHRRN